jgi:hypothetical protein
VNVGFGWATRVNEGVSRLRDLLELNLDACLLVALQVVDSAKLVVVILVAPYSLIDALNKTTSVLSEDASSPLIHPFHEN